jgi:hypothetical protein
MTTPPIGVERRIGQRFPFNLPVSFRDIRTAAQGLGFTQDLSSRGAFFFTDVPLAEGADIEVTLKMPREITLGESMRVRCRGRVLRVVNAGDRQREDGFGENRIEFTRSRSAETKLGVAVCLSGYDYLADDDASSAEFLRISALHSPTEVSVPASLAPLTPRSSTE